MDYQVGDEIKVELERVPIYHNPNYVPSYKVTQRTIVVTEVVHPRHLRVITKGVRRRAYGMSLPVSHNFYIAECGTGGVMSNVRTKYDVIFKEAN